MPGGGGLGHMNAVVFPFWRKLLEPQVKHVNRRCFFFFSDIFQTHFATYLQVLCTKAPLK